MSRRDALRKARFAEKDAQKNIRRKRLAGTRFARVPCITTYYTTAQAMKKPLSSLTPGQIMTPPSTPAGSSIVAPNTETYEFALLMHELKTVSEKIILPLRMMA